MLITTSGNTAAEGVQNTHHWSGRTETATENGVGQVGSRCHCGSHSSVALSPLACIKAGGGHFEHRLWLSLLHC